MVGRWVCWDRPKNCFGLSPDDETAALSFFWSGGIGRPRSLVKCAIVLPPAIVVMGEPFVRLVGRHVKRRP
jgi:hypothetical protein